MKVQARYNGKWVTANEFKTWMEAVEWSWVFRDLEPAAEKVRVCR